MRSRSPRFASFLPTCLLTALLAMLSVVGALAEVAVPRAKLVGEWEDKTEAIQQFRLSLRPDGSYRLTIRDLGGPKSDQGQWHLEGDTLVLVMTETERRDDCPRSEVRYQVGTLSEKTLSVRTSSGRNAFQFTRASR